MDSKSAKISELLTRGVAEIIVKSSLEKKLKSGRSLRIKFGIDPTSSKMHIGHMVNVRKLKALQDLGHQIVFIVGDYTARIGDPSGKDKTRPPLPVSEIKKNADQYFDQAYKILDRKKTEVHRQSEWYQNFSLDQVIKLTSHVTLAQMMAHETFRLRLKKGNSLAMHEVLYPLLQAYDSVAIRADVELGALDQKFNLLMGREIQPAYQMPAQEVMIMNYLIGLDGQQKMGKTIDNYISVLDSAQEMFGKVMSIGDEQIVPYFELATDVSMAEIVQIKKAIASGANPRDFKARLAREIIGIYHSQKEAEAAEKEFNQIFKAKQVPSQIPSIKVKAGQHSICDLLVKSKLVTSKSKARRLVEQGAVQVDQKIVKDWQEQIEVKEGMVVRVGKRKFIKLSIS